MVELLAPGVYVQETSFRAKPIEGVSTSTAAFVGLTRRGPIDDTPELVTSVGDFERVYGATNNLDLGSTELVNYVAHAVRAYFDNGGRRLYVARAFQPRLGSSGESVSRWIVGDAIAPARARFVARFPGGYGNGQLQLTQVTSPAAWASMERAPEGTMARTGANGAAQPARVTGGVPTFDIADGSQLILTVSGVTVTVTFHGSASEAAAATDLADPVLLTAANNQLTVSIGGVPQILRLPAASTPREQVLSSLNSQLRGGYARLEGDALVFGTDVRGSSAAINVEASALLGFAAATPGVPISATPSNVADLSRVSADEVRSLLQTATSALEASLDAATMRLVIRTTATGAAATITVGTPAAGVISAGGALGLGTPVAGSDGSVIDFHVKRGTQWLSSAGVALTPNVIPAGGIEFISLNVTITDADDLSQVFDNVAFGPDHPRFLGHLLSTEPTRGSDRLENGFAFDTVGAVTAFQIRAGLLGGASSAVITLAGGDDGAEPIAERFREALEQFEALEDIATVAAPGSSSLSEHLAIRDRLITHVERLRAYRMAVLDVPPDQTVGGMRNDRSSFDSKYAALYAPWVIVSNPDQRPGDESTPREIKLPPSGFICGIFARNDTQRGVFKAPANEVVRGTVRLETSINLAQQEVLNPEGVNVIRFFPGRGFRLWGARLASSDPEWNYVNLRRYFNYVEASIDRGTQWAVFEPNGDTLWSRIRETVNSFLLGEWRDGALLGATPDQAFFVRCDRSTMTQNDLDRGRLICEIGISVVRPAEFVVFRIGQSTSQARS